MVNFRSHTMAHVSGASTENGVLDEIRCKLALAYQQARDYWSANPDRTEHRPSDIHQSIEQWLVAKNILDGPAMTAPEVKSQSEDPQPPPSPTARGRRRSLKLPSLRPLNFRRQSLPVVGSPGATPRSRRRTTSTPSLPPSSTAATRDDLPRTPRSPRAAWASLTGGFKFPAPKRSRSIETDYGCIREETPSVLILQPTVSSSDTSNIAEDEEERKAAHEDAPITSRPDDPLLRQCECTAVDDDDDDDGTAYHDALPFCDSPQVLSRPQTPETAEPPTSIDPAYRALMPILHEIEAITENPLRSSLGEEFNDEGYVHFWETFAQLSPKEILYAVYAIRAGALDVHFDPPQAYSAATVLFVLWALAATGFAIYLYCQLP